MAADGGGSVHPGRSAALAAAVRALVDGALVAFPTETVYGLGADATRADAVARIFAAKGRPLTHPLIVHVGRTDDLYRFGRRVGPLAERLADAFWPGPLTIIVGRSDEIAPETVGGRDTVGLRMPDHELALALLDGFALVGSGAVAAPSANRFGGVSPTTAQHVRQDFGDEVAVVLDGGPCRVGVESTIVDVSSRRPRLLRPGGISSVEIEAVLGCPLHDDRAGVSRAPGMMVSHYAPAADIVLIDGLGLIDCELGPGDGLVTLDERRGNGRGRSTPHDVPVWTLPSDAAGYAAGLYATLRDADNQGVKRLLVVPPTTGVLLEAVRDRLAKAAAPRERIQP
ncbi:MAG: L-threonylcarbamoyladenylate synthase [Acidimicrobiia bacterium]|nr:L-threonylcarbamoyladenylate synthase [Acidimicrobiia bacterium]